MTQRKVIITIDYNPRLSRPKNDFDRMHQRIVSVVKDSVQGVLSIMRDGGMGVESWSVAAALPSSPEGATIGLSAANEISELLKDWSKSLGESQLTAVAKVIDKHAHQWPVDEQLAERIANVAMGALKDYLDGHMGTGEFRKFLAHAFEGIQRPPHPDAMKGKY